jgi:lambda repressor-like predicted transcriptional regulator
VASPLHEVPNERLRAAIAACGLSRDEVAESAGVDAKTLERWVAGRVPHPRNRKSLADALGLHPSDLWPEVDPIARLVPRDLAGIQCAYPSRSAFVAAFPPERLFTGAVSISLAGLSNNLLCQHYADRRLEELLALGTEVTCLFLDPDGPATAARESEEGYEPGHLRGLTALNISLLKRLRSRLPAHARNRLVLGTYEQTIRFNIILVDRTDDQTAVVQPYLPHSRGVEAPTLVVHPTAEPGLFDTFKCVFDEIRAESTPC